MSEITPQTMGNVFVNKRTINMSLGNENKNLKTNNTISYIAFNIKYALGVYFRDYDGIITNESPEDFLLRS